MVQYMSKNELEIQQPVNLIQMAIEKSASIETLKGLMDLQERWEANQARKEFKSAMVDFQREKPRLVKTEKAHNSKYNPLPKIQEAIDPVLSAQGLSYRWEQEEHDGKIRITCVLSHISGHEERTYMTAPLDTSGSKNAIQSIGSTVSYLKRYTLEGACGLSSDKDDDAGKPKELPELTPESARWNHAVTAVKQGKMATVKSQYTLSEENEVLIKQLAGV